ncbi:Gfo/Idh/MocA family protein [Nonomuraea aridisoli]|uniref:Oxidoreductase n=1 Tax=Nonomuraea aridisoli TaxID=2070368 RepID=A0A2W2EUM0_9ACTN|nr:Gfo/Idh/MocA family oxidoreductase [Nonomuraea aridisoli]PZG20489.1 oxidoreductase [Nonomuraea aridisoli]
MNVKRYVVCGLSNRGLASFVLPLLEAGGTVAGVVDPDQARVAAFNDTVLPEGHEPLPWYAPEDFDRMADELAPDTVIVASPDHTHADYILAALARDLDVISEKPMVTTAADAKRVLEAERDSKGSVLVTHNMRYIPRHRQVKELILNGKLGRVTHVALDYHVDIRHGGSYFQRWNRLRALSGGLSVHKSCHHLDLVAWWLDAVPQQVFAYGALNYFGPDSPHRPRDASGRPYTGAELRRHDPYYQAQAGSGAFPEPGGGRTGLYGLSYEHQYPAGGDTYIYDDEIDVEDTYSALVRYESGASLAYSLDFSSPWEGYRVVISGTHGQIESRHGRTPDGTPLPGSTTFTYSPLFGEPSVIDVIVQEGGHEGADPVLRNDLFGEPGPDSLRLSLPASATDGALAVATGEAMWRSVVESRPVDIAELL